MITKEQFDSLFDDNITKKEYDSTIGQINRRFSEICEKFLKTSPYRPSWYDYDTANLHDEAIDGHFDPKRYKETIYITGEYIGLPPGYFDFEFPTRWLWEENWEQEMNETTRKISRKGR